MFTPSRHGLLVLAFIVATGLAGMSSLQAAQAAAGTHGDCPDPAPDPLVAERQVESLRQRTAQIESLLAGGPLESPLSGLFAVDVRAEADVTARRDELAALLESGGMTPCPGASDAANAAVVALTRARLAFLELPTARRALLGELVATSQAQDSVARQIDAARRAAEDTGAAAGEARADAEEQALSAQSAETRELAGLRAIVEKRRQDLAGEAARRLAALQARLDSHQTTATRLSQLAATSNDARDIDIVLDGYRSVTAEWSQLARQVLTLDHDAGAFDDYDLGVLGADERARLEQQPAWSDYQAARERYTAELREQRAALMFKQRQQAALHYALLGQAASLRELFITRAAHEFDRDITPLSSAYAEALLLELAIVPYRWTTTVSDYLGGIGRELLRGDLDAALTVGHEAGILMMVLVVFGVYVFLARGVDAWLQRVQQDWLRRARLGGSTRGAVWLRRVRPYTPWLLAAGSVLLVDHLLADSAFGWLRALLPPLYYYIGYRATLTLLHERLLRSRRARRDTAHRETVARVERAGRLLARYVLGAVLVLYVIQAVVGRLLAYELVHDAAILLGLVLLAVLVWRERDVTRGVVERLPAGRLRKLLVSLDSGRRAIVFNLPVTLVVTGILATEGLRAWIADSDFAKRLSAQLFLRRARAQQREPAPSGTLTSDYLAWFDLEHVPDEAIRVEPGSADAARVLGALDSWAAHAESENSLALCGHTGVGKTSLLEQIGAGVQARGLRVIHARLADKVVAPPDFARWLGEHLGIDLAGGVPALLAADADMAPTVVLIDDLHNVFLRRRHGFEAFRFLATLLNADTTNLFWCATFNLYPWRYLEDVFSSEQPFRAVHVLRPWSDADIEQLIMRRHARTGYELRFDQLILATADSHAVDGDDFIETRFFQLLWEQSQGVPRTALALWREALVSDGSRTLHVTLPDVTGESRIASLPSEVLFALAAIMRHESLTSGETSSVSGLALPSIRHAFGLARQLGLIERGSDGRYRVCAIAHASLARALGARNLIYE